LETRFVTPGLSGEMVRDFLFSANPFAYTIGTQEKILRHPTVRPQPKGCGLAAWDFVADKMVGRL